MAVEHWRHYLQSAPFTILTDQKSLTHLDDQRLSTPWQHKALSKLMGLTYQIQYKKGTDNRVADTLSRAPHTATYELSAVSVLRPVWLQDVQDAYTQDLSATQLLSQLSINSPQGHFALKDGIIK